MVIYVQLIREHTIIISSGRMGSPWLIWYLQDRKKDVIQLSLIPKKIRDVGCVVTLKWNYIKLKKIIQRKAKVLAISESSLKRDSTGVFRVPRPRPREQNQPSSSQPNVPDSSWVRDSTGFLWVPRSKPLKHNQPSSSQPSQTVFSSQNDLPEIFLDSGSHSPECNLSSLIQTSRSADQSTLREIGHTGMPEGNVRVDRHEQIFIPGESHFYLQAPDNRVIAATLKLAYLVNGVPSWLNVKISCRKVDSPDRIFLYNHGLQNTFLKGEISENEPQNNDSYVKGYKCFIKTEDKRILYGADLVQLPAGEEMTLPTRTAVYVRVPGSNLIYAGVLKPLGFLNAPRWLTR
ncbi:uncharacterized protein LOC117176604 [Belonocnema kinseyi]|uniref:uncharacterized protein LOC117176604 n=1 Tax=Belonocnema kinseyi TaxID=2817044 RepID=UPI00143D74E2|nr:uncharacterized protein LOC117176604 [Belonocnema kinseyi]